MKNAIIMAGGKGTRMKSEKPKVLHEILNEPFLGLVINALKQAGTERIVTIVGYRHEEVEKAMAGQCEFAVQEPQLGTGHAVMQARQLEKETGITLVASGDCPCVRPETYAALYEQIGDADMAVLTAVPDDNGHYGRVIRRADGTVEKIVEYKDATEEERAVREVNTGIYAFRNESLFEGLKHLTPNNAQHEYYLTDLVAILQELGKTVKAVQCEDWREVEGINDNAAQAEASAYLQARINRKWMQEGVTIVNPASAYIGPYVTFGHDVTVYPDTYLYGRTTVEDGATIMPGTWLENAEVSKDETVGPFVSRKG